MPSSQFHYFNEQYVNYPNQATQPVDLLLEPLNDLVVSNGDLAVTSGVNTVVQSLLRRLYTPPHGYKRWVASTAFGLELLNSQYADSVYYHLSSPNTTSTSKEIASALYSCVQQDRRLKILSVEQLDSSSSNTVSIKIQYQLSDVFYSLQANLIDVSP